MKITTKLVLAVGCLAALTIVAQAQPVPLVNGDFNAATAKVPFFFDYGATPDGGINGTIPGWTVDTTGTKVNWDGSHGDTGVDLGDNNPFATPHVYMGNMDPVMHTIYGNMPNVGVHIYEVSFDLNAGWSNVNGHDTEVTLYADDNAGGITTIGVLDIGNPDLYNVISYNWFVASTLNSSFGHIALGFQNNTPEPGGWESSYTGLDNVTLNIVDTPEPGTLALLTLGGLSALVAIRRRS